MIEQGLGYGRTHYRKESDDSRLFNLNKSADPKKVSNRRKAEDIAEARKLAEELGLSFEETLALVG